MGKTKTAFIGEEEKDKTKRPTAKPDKVRMAGLKGGQRIKAIEAEEENADKTDESLSAKATVDLRKPKVRSKKYQAAKAKIDVNKLYPMEAAIKLAKEVSFTSFEGAIELHAIIKKQGFSAKIQLPHSFGKEKVIELASDKTVEKLKAGNIDFDVLLATADMMPKLVPFAKLLGPKGLMPNPKNGTLVKSAADANKFSQNSINLKTEKEAPVVHTTIGKVSMEDTKLVANLEAIFKAIGPKQTVRAYIAPTMGPSIKLLV